MTILISQHYLSKISKNYVQIKKTFPTLNYLKAIKEGTTTIKVRGECMEM